MRGFSRFAPPAMALFLISAAAAGRAPIVPQVPSTVDVACAGSCRVVGSGGGLCDFPTVQQAVAANATEIRVVSGVYAENVSVADRNLVVSGGFASCADAANGVGGVAGARSTIAPASGRALQVQQGGTGAMALALNHLVLSGTIGADGGALRIAGNAALATRNVVVTLDDTVVRDSAANGARGGGIAVQDADLNLLRSEVSANVATRGGGLYCLRAVVFLDDHPTTLGSAAAGGGNQAVLQGGGAWLDQGCSLDLRGVITNNVAGLDGGGVYVAAGGALYVGASTGNNLAAIVANAANTGDVSGGHGGGAVFASGIGAQVDITNAFLGYNAAGAFGGAVDNSVGGAIALVGGAGLLARRYNSPCWSDRSCVQFFANTVQGRGAAVYADTNAEVRLADTLFIANAAQAPNGSVLDLGSGSATRVVENSFIVQNQPGSSVVRLSGGNVLLRSNVIADNTYVSAAIELNFVNAEIRGVSVWQPGRVKYLNIGGGPEALVDCVFSDSASAEWPLAAQVVLTGNPIFRAPHDYDYRVYPRNGGRVSDVVDRCQPAHLQSLLAADLVLDAIGNARNVDLATITNGPGPIDVGPSEEQGEAGDLIFRDSFDQY